MFRPTGELFRSCARALSARSTGAFIFVLTALLIGFAISCHGVYSGSQSMALAGSLVSVCLSGGVVFRARTMLVRCDRARVDSGDGLEEWGRRYRELAGEYDELRRAHLRVRLLHESFADLLNLIDERSQGRLRALVEATGDELARLLEDYLAQPRADL
jgi:hypothetical protein